MSTGIDRLRHFFLYHAPAFAYGCVIIIMSSLPGGELPVLPFLNGDKLVHALEFGLFGLLLFRALRFPPISQSPFRLTLALGIPFAALDEIHQLFVPGRFCDVFDFLADCIGIIVFAAISARQHPMPEQRNTPDHAVK